MRPRIPSPCIRKSRVEVYGGESRTVVEVIYRHPLQPQLPARFVFGIHDCVVSDDTFIVDAVSHDVPQDEDEVDKFIEWLNEALLPKWREEADADGEAKIVIIQLLEAIETRYGSYAYWVKERPQAPKQPPTPVGPPCWFFNQILEQGEIFKP